MLDFEVQRCTRKCQATDRELEPGETIYSALVAAGAAVVRQDFCESAWEGPPEGTIGWWKSEVPSPTSRKIHWAPNDVMLHYFEQLEGQVDKQDTRYVLALLMIRRRILRLEEPEPGHAASASGNESSPVSGRDSGGDSGSDSGGEDSAADEVLRVHCARKEADYEVVVAAPDAKRAREIQDELAQLLDFGAKAG